MRICLEQVTKRYQELTVLDGCSLEIKSGEAIALTGPSGIGKTTLLRVILGLEQPDSGKTIRVRANGEEVTSSRRPIRAACVFQEDRLLEERSALDNVQLVSGVPRERARRELLELLPAESLEKPVEELSGGMRRRVCLVRACLHPAEILILDEPFAGLDAETRQKAICFLKKHLAGRTMILATHSLEGLEFCREITLPRKRPGEKEKNRIE